MILPTFRFLPPGQTNGLDRTRWLFVVRLMLAALTLLAVYSSVRWSLGRPDDADTSHVYAVEARCKALRAILPRDQIVGYVTDTPLRIGGVLGNDDAQEMDEILEFYRIQYAIAPTTLACDTSLSLIVGNFQDQSNIPRRCAEEHLDVIRDLGDGTLLLVPQSR